MIAIVSTPDVCGGDWRLDGTRMPTATLYRVAIDGWSTLWLRHALMPINQHVVPVTRPVCENCRFWHRLTDDHGACGHSHGHLGLEYERPDGTTVYVDRWRTGKYATCRDHERAVDGGQGTAAERA